MKKLRMGVLGCSKHYSLRIALPLKKSAHFVVPYAIASREEEKAKEFAALWGFSKAYGSYEELLSDPKVDFVYIPLPNHLHLKYIKESADAGKHIICEKPICLSADEVKHALNYCKEKDIILMEAFMYRFHPQWTYAKELILAGEIGEVLTVHGHFSYTNKDGNNIRNKADCGGGALYDIGCYTVSTARFLFGHEPIRVVSNIVYDHSFNTDILSSGMLDFGEGRIATFSVSTQMFPYQRITAIGSSGSLSIELPFNVYPDTHAKVIVSTSIGQRTIEIEIVNQYVLEFDAFAHAIIQKTHAPISCLDSVSNMAVIDALFKSAKTGAWEIVQNRRKNDREKISIGDQNIY